ncbi:MAG: hypothetical protein KC503_18550 [Myxococcales bacterium]|nr:hypothetical protein [Myxococcales bacterium]
MTTTRTKHLIAACSALLIASACGGSADWGNTGNNGSNGTTGTTGVGKLELTAKVLDAAHATIMSTRPIATQVMVNKLNLVLANNNILDTVVKNVEARVLSPISDGQATNTCPYLQHQDSGNTVSCRYLVDRAVEDALVDAPDLQTDIEQDTGDSYGQTLVAAELDYVKSWVGQAVLSGIDVGAVHAIELLRTKGACDQKPTPKQSAFKLGEKQGQALYQQAEQQVMPTIPRTQCNTDVIAQTILSAARGNVGNYVKGNPVCQGYTSSDLAVAVDLQQAETNRKAGIDEGLRAAHEAARVRLVSTWQCIRPEPAGGGDGGGGGGAGDPLVVDVDGNGVSLASGSVRFDLAASGDLVSMPRLGGGDALLALDRDGNGRIDDGSELFGNATRCGSARCADGIDALAQLDANNDGRIDARDPQFAKLRLFTVGSSSLRTLQSAGIRAITLSRQAESLTGTRATALRSIAFERADGQRGTIYDVWFRVQPTTARLRSLRAMGVTSTLRARLADSDR